MTGLLLASTVAPEACPSRLKADGDGRCMVVRCSLTHGSSARCSFARVALKMGFATQTRYCRERGAETITAGRGSFLKWGGTAESHRIADRAIRN